MADYTIEKLKDADGNNFAFRDPTKATPTDITNAINALDVSDAAVTNQFVTKVSETDGKISVSRAQPQISDVKDLQTTLNSKAADSAVVHKTGTETIDGQKTFTNTASIFQGKAYRDNNGSLLSTPNNGAFNELGNPTMEERAVIEETFNNQLECYPLTAVTYETADAGTNNWETLTVAESNHKKVWGGNVNGQINIANTKDFRFTIRCQSYVYLNLLYIYGVGSSGTYDMTIEKRKNGSETWETQSSISNQGLGWPGHLTLRHSNLAFNPSNTSQYGEVRFTMRIHTAPSSSYHIDRIRYYGGYPYKADPWISRHGDTNNIVVRGGVYTTHNGGWYEVFDKSMTVPIANGGTEATTAKAAEYNLLTNMETDLGNFGFDTIRLAIAGGATAQTPTTGRLAGYRTVGKLWDYIKSKISSVLGLTATNYGGKAATAGTSDKATDSDKLGGQLPSYYATKSEIPDVSGYETSAHAAATYATNSAVATGFDNVGNSIQDLYSSKENASNKVTTLDNSTTHYPSTSAVTTALSGKQDAKNAYGKYGSSSNFTTDVIDKGYTSLLLQYAGSERVTINLDDLQENVMYHIYSVSDRNTSWTISFSFVFQTAVTKLVGNGHAYTSNVVINKTQGTNDGNIHFVRNGTTVYLVMY